MEKHIELSRFLSFVLRHKPEAISLTLDNEGYADVSELIQKVGKTKHSINESILYELVNSDSKGRYSYDESGLKVRANQGHSLKVDLNLKEECPPAILYHGTNNSSADVIQQEGILKQSRQHVHLSKNIKTAIAVGGRRGEPVIFTINAREMFDDGYKFYLSKNKVWLTDNVPVSYLIDKK